VAKHITWLTMQQPKALDKSYQRKMTFPIIPDDVAEAPFEKPRFVFTIVAFLIWNWERPLSVNLAYKE
jgi:hypothetical protein